MTLLFDRIALNSPISSDFDQESSQARYISRLSRDRGAARWCETNRLKRCRLTDRRLTASSVQFPLIRTSPEIISAWVLISDAARIRSPSDFAAIRNPESFFANRDEDAKE